MKKAGKGEKDSHLSVLSAVLDGLDAYVYVVDISTYEILFINNKLKETLGLKDGVERGICWQILRPGNAEPCVCCPIGMLSAGNNTSFTWREHNPSTGMSYRQSSRIIAWPDGRSALLMQSTDITDIRKVFDRRLRQQEVMSDISLSFTTAESTQSLFYKALKKAGEFMGVNHAFLSEHRADEGVFNCLYEWHDDQSSPYIGRMGKWPFSPDMDFYDELVKNGYAAVNDYKKLTHPNFAAVQGHELRSFLNITIVISGKLWGIIGFTISNHPYDWTQSDIHLGKLIAGVFSGAVSRDMMEVDLRRAKDEAEQASRAKGEFLSSMSHEIRTPLNAIIGMTQIGRSAGDLQKKEYCLERIDSASKHLLGIINDILDISKIEANKLELSTDEFDLEKMLMNAVSVINFRVGEKKQNLMVNIDGDVASGFVGDEMRLSQVIVNLLTNAVKFTPEGGTVTLNARKIGESDGAELLLIEVVDTGIGISKDQQAQLFSPFKQAEAGTARKYGGTGLGLTISKGIVELMGGRIWLESELGKGAKFSFTAKLKPGTSPCCRARLAERIGKDGIRILAVSSMPETQEYFARVMSALALMCDIASCGAEALKLIQSHLNAPYNIIFVDGAMSDTDGITLAKNIMGEDPGSTIALMLSEAEWNHMEKDAVLAGVSSFVFKPLFPSRLVNAINESVGIAGERKQCADEGRVYDFSSHTILVAEDVEINREILAAILENTHVAIDFAEDGAQAVSMFESDPGRYDMILTDIQMPEMDGYEATERIRASGCKKGREIPIIAMTANVFREDIERCLAAGMDNHIGKPVNVDELLSLLGAYLHAERVDG